MGWRPVVKRISLHLSLHSWSITMSYVKKMLLVFALSIVTFGYTVQDATAADETGLICKVSPISEKCNLPALTGCDCVRS